MGTALSKGQTYDRLLEVEQRHYIHEDIEAFCISKIIADKNVGALLHAISADNMDMVKNCVGQLADGPEDISNLILSAKDGGGYTALHYTAVYASCSIKKYILNQITDQERLGQAIVEARNVTGSNVIHMALSRRCANCVLVFMGKLPQPKLIEAIAFSKDAAGLTPIAFAVHQMSLKELVCLLSNLPNCVFVEVMKQVITQKLTTHVGLEAIPHSSGRLSLLDRFSDYFVIPHDQSLTRRNALICYSTAGRDGALAEATEMKSALEEARFSVSSMEWTLYDGLIKWLRFMCNRMADSTSVLFLAVMAHGYSGHIKGRENSCGEIGDIIHCVRHLLPQHIPIVSTIAVHLLSGNHCHPW